MNRKATSGFKLLVVLFIVSYVALAYLKGVRQTTAKINDVKKLENRLMMLQQENSVLKDEINRLKTPEEIERQARNLGLVKKNEVSVRIIEKAKKK